MPVGGSCTSKCGLLKQTLNYLSHRMGRMYDSFYNSQTSTKFVMCLFFPASIFAIRYRVDTKLGYYVFIEEEGIYPDLSHRWIGKKWVNGKKYYLPDKATVSDLKQEVYAGKKVIEIKKDDKGEKERKTEKMNYNVSELLVGCRGRVFEERDNLAMAVRAYCRRDPRILIWRD